MELLYFVPAIIVVPTSIYLNLKLYKHKDEPYITKKSPSITFGLNIICIVLMICTMGIRVFYLTLPEERVLNAPYHCYPKISIILCTVYSCIQ